MKFLQVVLATIVIYLAAITSSSAQAGYGCLSPKVYQSVEDYCVPRGAGPLPGRQGHPLTPLAKSVEKGFRDTGRAVEKAANDAGKAIEKAAHDTGKAIEKAAHDAGDWVDEFFLEFCKIMTGKRDAEEARKHCNVSAGAACESDGTCYTYNPSNPNEKYEIGSDTSEVPVDPAALAEFVNSVTFDPSESELLTEKFQFEDIWVSGIQGMLRDWDVIGDSIVDFYPPNGNGVVRGPDGYASTGGSFLSLRGGGKHRYYHAGIDYEMKPGSTVIAGTSGKVMKTNGCAYCGRGGPHEELYKTIWIKSDSGQIISYLYVSPSPDLRKNDRVVAGVTPIGTAQDLSKRYPPRNSGTMTNHVHVQIKDRDGNWVSPDGSFEATKDRSNIKRAGDYYADEILRIQEMLNKLNKAQN